MPRLVHELNAVDEVSGVARVFGLGGGEGERRRREPC